MKCQICGKETETLLSCQRCSRLFCPECEALLSDDDEGADQPLCEECF